MADPFAKWRDRQATKAASPPPRTPGTDSPIAVYEATYLNRGWAMLLLLLAVPLAIGVPVMMFLYERELNAIPYSTGPRVLVMLLAFAVMIAVPLLGPTSRRSWSLFAGRIDIRQRPFVPLLGPYRQASIPFEKIVAARLGEALSGMSLFEIQTERGARYRLAPRTIGKGKQGRIDEAGLHDFIAAIRAAIQRAGLPVPPGEDLRTATSGLAGLIILGACCTLFFALCGLGVWMILQGEAVGMQALAFGVPFGLLFGGLFMNRWRKFRVPA